MAKIILFCTSCNPQGAHERDRRVLGVRSSSAPYSTVFDKSRRSKTGRRVVQDRRVREDPAPDAPDRRQSKGRRPFDGHAWFEGCLEEAIHAKWSVKKTKSTGLEAVLCPKCDANTPGALT